MRAKLFALALFVAIATSSRPSKANIIDDLAITFALIAVTPLVAVDTVFTVYDAAKNGCEELPATGWAVAETLVVTPQAVGANVLTVAFAVDADPDSGISGIMMLPTAWVTSLSTHGIWGWASRTAHHDALYGVSWIIGSNIAVTNAMVGKAAGGNLPSIDVSMLGMLMTTPSIISSSYHWANSDSAKAGWGALTLWSSALFAYGLISTPVGVAEANGGAPSTRRVAEMPALPVAISPTAIDTQHGPAPGLIAFGAW